MMKVLTSLLFALTIGTIGGVAQSALSNSTPHGVLHRRSYFYVGGQYVPGGTSQIAHGQMYVEHLVPDRVTQTAPLMLIHGMGMTGTNFLNTPDGRLGWADHFMGLGFEVRTVLLPSNANHL